MRMEGAFLGLAGLWCVASCTTLPQGDESTSPTAEESIVSDSCRQARVAFKIAERNFVSACLKQIGIQNTEIYFLPITSPECASSSEVVQTLASAQATLVEQCHKSSDQK